MRVLLAILVSIPAVISALVLAAHFLRAANLLGVAISLLILPLLCVPRLWARRVVQIMLTLGALEWVRTMMVLVQIRQETDQPWQRMALILGGVALFTVLSAAPLSLRPFPRKEHPAS